MKARGKRRDALFTVNAFSVFFEKILQPVLKAFQEETTRTRKELSRINAQCEKLSRKLTDLQKEYRTISDNTRRIELRVQGATQQAVFVLRDNVSALKKKIEELESKD